MADEIIKRDANRIPALAAVTNDPAQEIRMLRIDPSTGRLLVSLVGLAPAGDVTGPSSSTDNAIVRFDGTSGKVIQDYTSGAPTISDTGDMTLAANKKVTFSAAKNYEVVAANINSDDRLILRATSALAARFWFDSFAGTTGFSLAEVGVERAYFGTELGGNVVLAAQGTYGLKLSAQTIQLNNLTYPSADGTNGHVLTTNGAGVLSFQPSNVAAGTYSPTVTPGTNVSSATANGSFIYSRVGSTVQIAGSIDVTATASGAAVIQLSIPVAVTFSDTHKLSGSGAATTGSVMSPAYLRATAGAQTATIDWIAPNTQPHTLRFQATYTTT